MIRWEYAHLFVVMHGNSHVVAGINGRVLDYRGQWAELIAEHLSLPEWRIVENRLDVFDKSEARHVFLAFRKPNVVAKEPSET